MATFHKYEELAFLLLSHNADVDAEDYYGNTPLMYAAEEASADLVKTLIEHGAYIGHRNAKGETALQWAENAGREDNIALLGQNR